MGKNTHTHTNISSISLLQSNLKTNQQSKQIRSSTTIMSASTVNVKNISSATSEKEIKDFFSFCGKISSIEVTKSGESQNATVTFEKETAAKTALLLDNTQLGATQVQVSSATGSNDDDGSHFTQNTERDSDEITQEEKPRARIAAEYIAHGYVLGDQAIQKAIDLDTKHGVSNRFLSTLTNLDQKYHATDKAKSVDQSYGHPKGQQSPHWPDFLLRKGRRNSNWPEARQLLHPEQQAGPGHPRRGSPSCRFEEAGFWCHKGSRYREDYFP